MKYKLIKQYPGSLELGNEINYSRVSDSYTFEKKIKGKYGSSYIDVTWFPKKDIENSPEYWQEVVEKDYEILSFKNPETNRIITKHSNNLFGIHFGEFTEENQLDKIKTNLMEILEKTKKGITKPISRTDQIHQMSKEYISLLKNDNDNIYVKEFVESNGILIHLKYNINPNLNGYAQINVQFYFVESLLTTTINNASPINTVFKLFLNSTFYYSYSPTQNCQLMSFGDIASFINSFASLTANYASNGCFNNIDEKAKLKYKPFTSDISLLTKRIIKTIFTMLQKYSHFKNMVLIDVVSDQLPYVDEIFSDYYVNPGMPYTNTRGTPMTIKIFKTSSFYENIQTLT